MSDGMLVAVAVLSGLGAFGLAWIMERLARGPGYEAILVTGLRERAERYDDRYVRRLEAELDKAQAMVAHERARAEAAVNVILAKQAGVMLPDTAAPPPAVTDEWAKAMERMAAAEGWAEMGTTG